MKPSALRQAIAAHLTEVLGPLGWAESTFPYPLFPDLESRFGHHLTFAVGLQRDSVGQGRQRIAEGLVTTTTIAVRFACATDLASVPAYDQALDAEALFVAALATLKMRQGDAIPLRIEGIQTRSLTGDGTVYVGEIIGSVLHQYPLTS